MVTLQVKSDLLSSAPHLIHITWNAINGSSLCLPEPLGPQVYNSWSLKIWLSLRSRDR